MISDSHAWQNDRVINMVQAMIGGLTTNMRAVSIETDYEQRSIDVYFALVEQGPDEIEEMEEILDALDVLAVNELRRIDLHVWVGSDWVMDWPGREHRVVYAAHKSFREG